MTDVAKAQGHLKAALALFMERYRLTAPDESAGAQAIERAIAAGADADIPRLRTVLADYNLYERHEALIAERLSEAEAALAEADIDDSPEPEESDDATEEEAPPAKDEAPAKPEPEAPKPTRANATRATRPRKARGNK